MSQDKEQALPFFARYLEGQFCEDLSEEEMDAVQGGHRYRTHPHQGTPFDFIATTFKYPSDNEESGDLISIDEPVTKRYPSDTDEYAVTLKYPSDSDEDSLTASV